MSSHPKSLASKNTPHKHTDDMLSIRLNLTLHGETARILLELKSRGIIRSYADGVNQAIRLFYEKITQQNLLSARLKAFQDGLEEEWFVGE